MNPPSDRDGSGSKIDWMGQARAHGRVVLIVAAAVATMVAVLGGAYLRWGQPTQTVASLEFRPTFATLAEMEYPNGLPFSPNDVIAGPIIDLVFDHNNINCDREAFRAGFVVEQRSDQSVFLDLEFQARLSEPRITMVERKALQEEHTARRKALPVQYRLVFIAPAACAALPQAVISKAMTDVLTTWATESETKRGVLKVQAEVLTPSSLDVKVEGPGGQLLRADLLRNALHRIAQNIEPVKDLPGAALIRLGPDRITFGDVQGKLVDLVGSRLDPLVMTSGRSMVRDSSVWVAETVAGALRKKKGAEQKIQYYQNALREYSGGSDAIAASPGRTSSSGIASGANAPQSQVPLDESFINRIVALSEFNARYRQKLTDAMVDAQLEAVFEEQRASYYQRLQQSVGGPGSEGDAADLETKLDEITKDGKELTKKFGELYDEFSRVSLRSSASLYETRKPVTIETSQQYVRRSLVNLVLFAFFGTLLLMFGFFVVRSRMKPEPR